MRPGRRRAFTFIELLVVLAMLSVLAVLLLPLLMATKRKAQQIRSLHNVRQLTMNCHIGAADTGGRTGYNSKDLWMAAYIRQPKIMMCPSTRRENPLPITLTQGTADTAWTWANPEAKDVFVGSYGFNGWLYDKPAYGALKNPSLMMGKLARIQKPPLTPVFCDAIWPDLWPMETNAPFPDLYRGQLYGQGMGRCTIARHGGNPAKAPQNFNTRQPLPGRINMGFADGHAASVSLENLWQFYWHLDWQVPGQRPK